MIKIDDRINEHNPNWPEILENPYGISIVGILHYLI